MKWNLPGLRIGFALALGISVNVRSADPLTRVANLTLTNLPPAPPVYGFTASNAFPGVSLITPIALATPLGETNRLFILERAGRLVAITNLAAPNRTLVMDLSSRVDSGCENGALGFAFHPGFATNRYFYIFYSTWAMTSSIGLHQRISRFEMTATNANVALTNTELPLLTQFDEACNHNGGCLQFGPDGYLYASLGDEGDQNDFYNNSQRIDKDFFSGILRLDVDKRATNLAPTTHPALMGATNYFIPAGNPFVGATQLNGAAIDTNKLRAEFWAVGLRNPWRFSFDPETGVLYCGDVGGGSREEVDVIVRGGNYGWAYREASLNGPKVGQTPPGFTSLLPINEYDHGSTTNQGNCITGGLVYRGSRIAQLTGRYVFCDYETGHFWALTPDGTNAVAKQHLFSDAGIASFGTDPRNGDVLVCDIGESQVKRLLYNTNQVSGQTLPATLADTGVFTNLTNLSPAPGIAGYDLNLPFWSDNALKSRWFSVPNTNLTITFSREGNWSFPTGTVWIKHFELELTNGVPASRKRLETRLLIKNAGGGYGITYRWGSSLTNASLVPEEGLDEAFVINEGGGILRTQVWHYPGRVECLRCHTAAGGFALGFNSAQLNRNFDYAGTMTNQIAALSHAGYFNTNVTGIHTLSALVHPTNQLASLEARARSYLAANCVQCHQPAGTAQALWDARITTRTADAGLVDGALINSGGDTNSRVLAPGDIANSVLLARISLRGVGQMPPLASTLVDTQGVALLAAWITNDLPAFQTFADWQIAWFGSTNSPAAAASADPDGDGLPNRLETLVGTNPTNALDAWKISITLSNSQPRIQFPQIANRGFEVQRAVNLSGSPWTPLDVPENAPFFMKSNRTASVPDSNPVDSTRFYRVRVFEP